jgi:hypothetical protein
MKRLPALLILIVLTALSVSCNTDSDESVDYFPQLKTQSEVYMTAALTGELVLEDGYLHVGEDLIIWQPDYFLNSNDGTIEILDREGKVVGRVGEEIYMGGGEIKSIEFINSLIKEPLPQGIDGPFWLQGAETRLNSNPE